MNILFTNLGNDVEFVRTFLWSMEKLGVKGKIIAANESIAPSSYTSDEIELTGSVLDPGYINKLLGLCQRYQIQILIPRDDRELCLLANNAVKFAELGCMVLTSSASFNSICASRWSVVNFLRGAGLRSPLLSSGSEFNEKHRFPFLVRCGDRSVADRIVNNSQEMEFEIQRMTTPSIVEHAIGDRYEIDCFVGFDETPILTLPRLQDLTPYGTVQKTIRMPALISMAQEVLASLPGGAFGNIVLECSIVNSEVYFTDIIPRFTAGSSLCYHAGADVPFYVFELVSGFVDSRIRDEWIEGVSAFNYSTPIYTFKNSLLPQVSGTGGLNDGIS
jgi:carbamoyl-phosphate synthase large subunit